MNVYKSHFRKTNRLIMDLSKQWYFTCHNTAVGGNVKS